MSICQNLTTVSAFSITIPSRRPVKKQKMHIEGGEVAEVAVEMRPQYRFYRFRSMCFKGHL